MSDTPPDLFDRALIRRRIARAMAKGGQAFLFDHLAADLCERLSFITRDFPLVIDLGHSEGRVPAALAGLDRVGRVVSVDRIAGHADIIADEDWLPVRGGVADLVVSPFGLGFVNDLPGALIQILRVLKPDGLFMAALPGPATLEELRVAFAEAEAAMAGGISPRIAPFIDVKDAGQLLQRAGFAMPVTDSERITVRYNSVFDLMRDLRGMGATNALRDRVKTPLSRAMLFKMAEIYANRFSDPDGRVRASFEIIHMSGWAPKAG